MIVASVVLPRPGRPDEEHVVERLPSPLRRLERDLELLLRPLLADEVVESPRPERLLDLLVALLERRSQELAAHAALLRASRTRSSTGSAGVDRGERLLGLDERVAELDERVAGDELARRARLGDRRRLGERALELEHDPLGGLLADTGNRLEARRVLERDRALELVRRGARDDGERDLRADSADTEKLYEERALGRVGEPVELERVLADVEIASRPSPRTAPSARRRTRRRRADEVADAADVDDEPVDRPPRRDAAETRDHLAASRSGEPSAWQIATAYASASCERPRLVVEPEDQLDHALHLPLLRPPVAAHRLLDACRRVLGALDSGFGGRDEHGAARLPDGERDAGVGTHVGLLERDGVGLVLRNELPNSLEDRQQPHVEPLPRGRPPAARPHRPEAPVASVDDPVPARRRPWVDAEDLHVWKLCGSPDVPPARPSARLAAGGLAVLLRPGVDPLRRSRELVLIERRDRGLELLDLCRGRGLSPP